MEPTQHPKYIAIHFTLKGQDFEQIKPVLELIKQENPAAILINGFMSREDLLQKGITDTTVPDTLNRLFPEQRSFFKDGEVRRRDMFAFAYDNKAKVYVIGRIKDGVKEEAVLYLNAGVDVIFIRIDENAKMKNTLQYPATMDEVFSLEDALKDFGIYLLSNERIERVVSENPQLNDIDLLNQTKQVSDTDVKAWFEHPNRLSFLNNKNTQNVEDQNKDLAQGAEGGTAEQHTTGSNENLTQGEGPGNVSSDEGKSEEAGEGEQNADASATAEEASGDAQSGQTTGEGEQNADAGTNAGEGQE